MKTMCSAQAAELGRRLVEDATSNRRRVAAQALSEEETILVHGGVRAALVVKQDGRMRADWDRLMGCIYNAVLR